MYKNKGTFGVATDLAWATSVMCADQVSAPLSLRLIECEIVSLRNQHIQDYKRRERGVASWVLSLLFIGASHSYVPNS